MSRGGLLGSGAVVRAITALMSGLTGRGAEVHYRVSWRGDGHDDARIERADARRARRRDRNLWLVERGGWR